LEDQPLVERLGGNIVRSYFALFVQLLHGMRQLPQVTARCLSIFSPSQDSNLKAHL